MTYRSVLVNIALNSGNDGALVTNATTAPGVNSSYQMVGFDAFGSDRNERRYNSFNYFVRGDATSDQAPTFSNRRWLAVVDGSNQKVLYNQVLPDAFAGESLNQTDITEIRAAVNMAGPLTVIETFAMWAEDRIPELSLQAEDADADGDGMVNLLEYAYGTNPVVPDSEKGPRIVVEDGLLVLRYQRSLTAEISALSVIGGDSPDSTDPQDFSALEEIESAGDEVELVRVPLPATLGSRSFLRLVTSAL